VLKSVSHFSSRWRCVSIDAGSSSREACVEVVGVGDGILEMGEVSCGLFAREEVPGASSFLVCAPIPESKLPRDGDGANVEGGTSSKSISWTCTTSNTCSPFGVPGKLTFLEGGMVGMESFDRTDSFRLCDNEADEYDPLKTGGVDLTERWPLPSVSTVLMLRPESLVIAELTDADERCMSLVAGPENPDVEGPGCVGSEGLPRFTVGGRSDRGEVGGDNTPDPRSWMLEATCRKCRGGEVPLASGEDVNTGETPARGLTVVATELFPGRDRGDWRGEGRADTARDGAAGEGEGEGDADEEGAGATRADVDLVIGGLATGALEASSRVLVLCKG
jgi:hypothetical protein